MTLNLAFNITKEFNLIISFEEFLKRKAHFFIFFMKNSVTPSFMIIDHLLSIFITFINSEKGTNSEIEQIKVELLSLKLV